MPKITRWNTWYISPYELIKEPGQPGFYDFLWPEEHDLLSDRDLLWAAQKEEKGKIRQGLSLLLQSFHPLENMGRDFTNTFRPYKSKFHATNDTFQFLLYPLKGLFNILRAILMLAAGAFMLFATIFSIPAYLVAGEAYANDPRIKVLQNPLFLATTGLAWLMDGVTSMLRGITQIIFTPLIPLRLISRRIASKIHGWQKFEDDRGVKKLASLVNKKRYHKTKNSFHGIFLRKLHKARQQGREVENIDGYFSLLYPHPTNIIPQNVSHYFVQDAFDELEQHDKEEFVYGLIRSLKIDNEAERNLSIIRLMASHNLLNFSVLIPAELKLVFNHEKYQRQKQKNALSALSLFGYRSRARTTSTLENFERDVIDTLTLENEEQRTQAVLALLVEHELHTPAKVVMMMGTKKGEEEKLEPESPLPFARLPLDLQAHIANYCDGRVAVKPRALLNPLDVLPENLRPFLDMEKFNALQKGDKIEIVDVLVKKVEYAKFGNKTAELELAVIAFLQEKQLYVEKQGIAVAENIELQEGLDIIERELLSDSALPRAHRLG